MTALVRRALLLLFLLLHTLPAVALDEDIQTWGMVTLRTPLNEAKTVELYGEVQKRASDVLTDPDALLLRGAVGYKLTAKESLWAGYAWSPRFNPTFQSEHRPFQQFLSERKLKDLSVINRTRLEERFIDGVGGTSLRGRHMLRLVYPIGCAKKWSVAAYDEVFFNLNNASGGPQAGFDQNRLFIGLNRKLSKHLNLDVGYIANTINRPASVGDRLNHILFLGLYMNF